MTEESLFPDKGSEIKKLEEEIANLEELLNEKKKALFSLKADNTKSGAAGDNLVTRLSSPEDKIKLFRSLFVGREDVYAKRFESAKSGKAGYSPACKNEWVPGICLKPKIKCSECERKDYIPLSDTVIKNHLRGEIPSLYPGGIPKPFVAGVYPLLSDETCRFLAVDFDKEQWLRDVEAFLVTCKEENIPAYLERSRSGNGGHIWIFFEEPVTARLARTLGACLMTKTLDRRPEIGLDSFDRFFPNQDTMPQGGFGNLIAFPLQKKAREKNHSVFIDEKGEPFPDQWEYLSKIQKISPRFVEEYVRSISQFREILPVMQEHSQFSAENAPPWEARKAMRYPIIEAVLPERIEVVLSDQIYLDSTGLPPILRNRILRLASFANPEFYKAQAMRLPTWNKPRILYCYEQHDSFIALPIGCLDDLRDLLDHYQIKISLDDKRNAGVSVDIDFLGELSAEQLLAAQALLRQDTGVLSATTAFGKTVIALWLMAQRKVNTLILVHRKQLMEQWVERIVQFLGISKKEVGCFGGGKNKRNGLIDVAVMQSLGRKEEVPDWIKEYGQIIVDECHHISAFSFEKIIRQSNAKFKMGLSATLSRKDGQDPIIFMNLGQVRYHVDARKQAEVRTFTHKVIVRETGFTVENPEEASNRIQEVFHSLLLDEERNKLIVRDIRDAVATNRQILVLTERRDHVDILSELIEDVGCPLFILQGGMGKKQIRKVMEGIQEVPTGESFILLATGRYLGEGFDLPALNTLFLTFPISWKGTLTQYAGRLHRDYHLKSEVQVYDYVDVEVPVLGKMHRKRLKGYAALGYSSE